MKYIPAAILLLLCLSCAQSDTEDTALIYLDEVRPQNTPQVFGEGIVSIEGRFDLGFTISPDGKLMIFGTSHESDSNQTCLYQITLKEGQWSDPSRDFLPNNTNTYFPQFGPKGKLFYYAKYTEGRDTDIWSAKFRKGKVSDSSPLEGDINSIYREAGHGVSADGILYFTSNRDDDHHCCGDIYSTSLSVPNTVTRESKLNTHSDEESLFFSPDGDYIIIQSWRTDSNTKHDLYISYLTHDGSWTDPRRLNEKINSSEIEQRPFVSPDKKYLFFSRMSVTKEGDVDLYDSDIYWVSTEQVFQPYVFNDQVNAKTISGDSFQLELPSDLFKDVDDQDLKYSAKLADGNQLPNDVSFDAEKRVLYKTNAGLDALTIIISATDANGNVGSFEVIL